LQEIYKIKGLVKIIVPYIRPDETIIPRIILKMLKVLCENDKTFYKSLIDANILTKLITCLQGTDDRMQYYALSLLNILLYQKGSHFDFLEKKGIKLLMKITDNALINCKFYIVEIFGILCGDPLNYEKLEEELGLADLFLKLSMGPEVDLRLSAVSVIINLVATSDKFKIYFLNIDALNVLKKLFLDVNGTAQNLRPGACRALTTFMNNGDWN
jgi:hypothetical protein